MHVLPRRQNRIDDCAAAGVVFDCGGVCMNKLLVIVAVLTNLATGCDGGFCNDSEGLGPGLIVLRNDGFVIPTVYGSFGSTPERVFPYDEESPFLKCRAIGTLSVRHPEAILDSDHYPALEWLGGIGVELEDISGRRAIDDVAGFDGVIEFGGMSDPFANAYLASIGEVSGFNNVQRLTGSLLVNGEITGLQMLREIDGSLYVAGLPNGQTLERIGGDFRTPSGRQTLDVRNLREVGGNLTVQQSQFVDVGFPSLNRVGGNVLVDGNSGLETWRGFAPGSAIEGSFEGTFNQPILDDAFSFWVASGLTNIQGTTRICANGPYVEGEERTCTGF
jgi:hypothetical protein